MNIVENSERNFRIINEEGEGIATFYNRDEAKEYLKMIGQFESTQSIVNHELSTLYTALESFIKRAAAKSVCNSWINTNYIKLYTRKSIRKIVNEAELEQLPEIESFTCLDLATIEVHELLRHRGIFNSILNYMQINCPWDGIFVESVNNSYLLDSMTRKVQWNNWKKVGIDSFIWIKP